MNFLIAPFYLDSFFNSNLGNQLVLKRIQVSNTPNPNRVIFLGESVANQLFGKSPASLTTNGATLIVGQYILAYNAIQNFPNLEYIVLAASPSVIGNHFEAKKTYNNLLKPFYTFENRKHFSETIHEKMQKKWWSYFSILPAIKVVSCLSDVDFSTLPHNEDQYISDVSAEYLRRLKNLADENGVELVVVSTPINKKKLQKFDDWYDMEDEVYELGLEDIFEGYFENIIYLDKKHFKSDGSHLKKIYLNNNKEKLIKKMLPEEVFNAINVPFDKKAKKKNVKKDKMEAKKKNKEKDIDQPENEDSPKE